MNVTARKACSVVLCVAVLCGCGQKRRWTEDVQLSDGRSVRVERAQDWERSEAIGESKAYNTSRVQLTLRTESGEPHGVWTSVEEAPIVLDFDAATQEFFLIAAPRTCGFWIEFGAPVPAYWEYRSRAGNWVRGPLAPEHVDLPANLLIVTSLKEIPAHVSAPHRDERNRAYAVSDVEYERYYRVLSNARVAACPQ